jgi:hypothetical protein
MAEARVSKSLLLRNVPVSSPWLCRLRGGINRRKISIRWCNGSLVNQKGPVAQYAIVLLGLIDHVADVIGCDKDSLS